MRRIYILGVLVALACATAGAGEAQSPEMPANAVDLWDNAVPLDATVEAIELESGVRPDWLPPTDEATLIDGAPFYVESAGGLVLGPDVGGGGASPQYMGNPICYSTPWGHLSVQRGTYPVQQRIHELRYYCAWWRGGPQYYRESHIHGETTICSWDRPWKYKTEGGNGYQYTVMRSGISTACQTPVPWLVLHHDLWQEWFCNTWGDCYRRGTNAYNS